MESGNCRSCNDERAFRVIRREIALLSLLSIAAVPTYLFTRAAAERSRTTEIRIAAEWYRRGQQQLREGNTSTARDSLRHASVHDRDNPKIALALAQVLAATNRDGEARTALLRLREISPNDPEVHLELARLSARGKDMPEALLYYHLALYGLKAGTGTEGESRRDIRMELVRFLLDHQERGRALSELLILAADSPSKAESVLEVARLFLEAGDAARALEQYRRASAMDEESAPALAGAGEASFLLGDYATARRFLARAVELDNLNKGAAKAADLLATTRLIESANPLAARLPFAARKKRLVAAFAQAAGRLEGCLEGQRGGSAARAELEQLRAEVESMRPALDAKELQPDPDLVPNGAELVFRIEETTRRSCGEPTGLDLALLLIGRKHGGTGT